MITAAVGREASWLWLRSKKTTKVRLKKELER